MISFLKIKEGTSSLKAEVCDLSSEVLGRWPYLWRSMIAISPLEVRKCDLIWEGWGFYLISGGQGRVTSARIVTSLTKAKDYDLTSEGQRRWPHLWRLRSTYDLTSGGRVWQNLPACCSPQVWHRWGQVNSTLYIYIYLYIYYAKIHLIGEFCIREYSEYICTNKIEKAINL
jgi:hypothetical protein